MTAPDRAKLARWLRFMGIVQRVTQQVKTAERAVNQGS